MEVERWSSSSSFFSVSISSNLRRHLLEFLLHASDQHLRLRPIVKYTSLFFFAGRFLPSLPRQRSSAIRKTRRVEDSGAESWLLNPLRESNLQLFALISIWVSSKVHDTRPLSVKSLKALGDRLISDQHFTTRDFVEGELVFLEVLRFEVGTSDVAFIYLEDLLIQFRELSKLGELVNLDVCMEIMDLLYETEETSILFGSPYSLAASILVTTYVISVTKQRWEFPLLPWVKFTTSYDEEHIERIVMSILRHVLKPEAVELLDDAAA